MLGGQLSWWRGDGERRDAPEHPGFQGEHGQAGRRLYGRHGRLGRLLHLDSGRPHIANETTLTGSLGVIFQLNNFAEAADKYGIGQVVIKSGKYKDMGNAFREMRPDEREIFQSIVDESYSEFVDVISEGRKIPKDRVREIADGRVYSGTQAKDLGLVDSFGDLDEASATAGRLADTKDTTVVRYVQADPHRVPAGAPGPAGAAGQQIMDAAGLDLEPKPYYSTCREPDTDSVVHEAHEPRARRALQHFSTLGFASARQHVSFVGSGLH